MGHLTRIANMVVHNLEKGPVQAQITDLIKGDASILEPNTQLHDRADVVSRRKHDCIIVHYVRQHFPMRPCVVSVVVVRHGNVKALVGYSFVLAGHATWPISHTICLE